MEESPEASFRQFHLLIRSISTLQPSGNGTGCCPFHDDSTPSFWVNDEIGRFACFGCDASGDVIDFVMKWENCDFHDAIKMLDDGYVGSSAPFEIRKSEKQDRTDRIASAYKIWLNSSPIENTPAELYLKQRGLMLDELPELENLRFARLSFERSATLHPVLVAAVQTEQGEFAGIQRTYLTEDGRKLDAHSAKRSLGALKGNAIIIGYDIEIAQDCFYVCEGLEDGLGIGHPRSYRPAPDAPLLLDRRTYWKLGAADCGFMLVRLI